MKNEFYVLNDQGMPEAASAETIGLSDAEASAEARFQEVTATSGRVATAGEATLVDAGRGIRHDLGAAASSTIFTGRGVPRRIMPAFN